MEKRLVDDPVPVTLDADTREIRFTQLKEGIGRGPYAVYFADDPNIILRIGGRASGPLARFQHPNIIRRAEVKHEFKHSNDSGRKWWTSRAGVDLFLAIPKEKFTLLPVCGYSYPQFLVAGQEITLNVSGGCGGPDPAWRDAVNDNAATCVDLPVRVVRALAEVAVSPDEL